MGWPKPPPGPKGWSGHPKRPKKKKKERMRFGLWGWLDHPLGPGGGFGHSLLAVGGGFGHLHALGGSPATPKGQNPFFPSFFWGGGGLLGWPDHPQRPGVASATPIRPVWGGRSQPLAKNGVVRPPHFWEGGGSATPISSFFFFSFFFFSISFFFSKKKKNLKCKTTPFCPKRRCFRRAQNGVVLEWRVVWTIYHQKGPK
jgi:hypothetical protein